MYLCRGGCGRSLRTRWLLAPNQFLPAGRFLPATWPVLTRWLLGAHCESLSPGHFESKDDELALGRMSRIDILRIGFNQGTSTAVTESSSSPGARGSVTGFRDGS